MKAGCRPGALSEKSPPRGDIPLSVCATVAAYRFLANDEVEWADILAPHWVQTQRRKINAPRCRKLIDTFRSA